MANRNTNQAAEETEVKTEGTQNEETVTETATPEVKTEKAQPAQVPAQPENVDPWKEQVPVYVPRARASEDQNAYVCVNDRRFSVPRNGKTQMLPRPIAEALQTSIEAEYKAEEYAENIRVHEPGVGPIA